MANITRQTWEDVLPLREDVFPCFARDKIPNGVRVNSELLAESKQATPGSVKYPDLANLPLGQLGVAAPFSASNSVRAKIGMMLLAATYFFWMQPQSVAITCWHLPLSFCVSHVLGMRSEPKVCRVDAEWVVAARTVVARKEFARPLFRRDPAGNDVSRIGTMVEIELPISAVETTSLPQPTFVRFALLDFGPEAKDVLRGQGWSGRISFSHDVALLRGFVVVRAESRADNTRRLAHFTSSLPMWTGEKRGTTNE